MSTTQYADLAKAIVSRNSTADEEAALTLQAYAAQHKLVGGHLNAPGAVDEYCELENLISDIQKSVSTTETRLRDYQERTRNGQPQPEPRNLTKTLEDPLKSDLQRIQTELERKQHTLLHQVTTLDQTITPLRTALNLPPSPPPQRPILIIDFSKLSDDFSTVVQLHGQWHEVVCCFCGNNVSKKSKKLFKGWGAVMSHIRLGHKLPDGNVRDDELFRWCSRRVFGEEDVERMRKGEEPLDGGIEGREGDGVGSLWSTAPEPRLAEGMQTRSLIVPTLVFSRQQTFRQLQSFDFPALCSVHSHKLVLQLLTRPAFHNEMADRDPEQPGPQQEPSYVELGKLMQARDYWFHEVTDLIYQGFTDQLRMIEQWKGEVSDEIQHETQRLERLRADYNAAKSFQEEEVFRWQLECQGAQEPTWEERHPDQPDSAFRTKLREMQLRYKQDQDQLVRIVAEVDDTIDEMREALGPLVPKPTGRTIMPRILSDDLSTIIEYDGYDGQWHEIACCFCGANRAKGTGRLFKGWLALINHIRKTHEVREDEIKCNELFTWCVQRTFSDDEVKRLRKDDGISFISKSYGNETRALGSKEVVDMMYKKLG